MTDREALAAALDRFFDNWTDEAGDFELMAIAARERLAQLPEKRAGRVELGERGLSGVFHNVYPAELVERIAMEVWRSAPGHEAIYGAQWDLLSDEWQERYFVQAVAVLDALNGETP